METRTQRATRLRRLIGSSKLLPLAFVIWRTARELGPRLLIGNWRLRRKFRSHTPIPPGGLIFSATGTRDVAWFLDSGSQTAMAFRKALDSIGRPLESFEKVFELGCGCGRVLRQWKNVTGPDIFASDYNPKGINWGKQNIPFVSFTVNGLHPPLSYDSGSFDLCYAVSVFTHLPENLQEPWLAELHRVLRPGGILIVTLSGEGDLVRVTPAEQDRFRQGEVVVVDAQFAGTNMCGVYHPESFVREKWAPFFSVSRFFPLGALGSPKQDLYILERA